MDKSVIAILGIIATVTIAACAIGIHEDDTSAEKIRLNVVADECVTATKSMELNEPQSVTLYASVKNPDERPSNYIYRVFDGWYDANGKLLSIDNRYSFYVSEDTTIYAASSGGEIIYDIKTDGGSDVTIDRFDLPFGITSSVIRNHYTNDIVFQGDIGSVKSLHLDVGRYDLYKKVLGMEIKTGTCVVDGHYQRNLVWHYGGKEYKLSFSDSFENTDLFINGGWRLGWTDSQSKAMIDTRSIVNIANDLKNKCKGLGEEDTANFVLAFVQRCILYQYDSNIGKTEYYKYPLETLFTGRGDCEDTSILYCSLMKAMGFDTALLEFSGSITEPGHVAAAVALKNDLKGKSYYNDNGKHYYYCETTNNGRKVGDTIDGYVSAHMIIV